MRLASIRSIAAFVFVQALAGCAESQTKTTSRQPDYAGGRHVYNAFCAECHGSGRGGAPRIDDPVAWETRALGFPSLLTEHATNGFLDMPEKGARSDLSDEAVQDAVHYMIRQIARGDRQ